MCELAHLHIRDMYVNIFASYELTALNSVTRSHGTHIFTCLDLASEQIFLPLHTNMSTTLVLQPTYRPHIIVPISEKTMTLNIYLPC